MHKKLTFVAYMEENWIAGKQSWETSLHILFIFSFKFRHIEYIIYPKNI